MTGCSYPLSVTPCFYVRTVTNAVSVYDCVKPGHSASRTEFCGKPTELFQTERVINLSQGPLRTQHTTKTQQTNTHAPGGNRTRDHSSRAASDREEYRFHGIWHNIQISTQVRNSVHSSKK